MTRWTPAQFDEYMVKRESTLHPVKNEPGPKQEADEGKESVLQGKIEKWAEEWGHPCESFRQNPRARRTLKPGWPDIRLILPRGRVLWIELKSKKGRLSEEQKLLRLQFLNHGHEIHEIRSYVAFLRLVTGEGGRG